MNKRKLNEISRIAPTQVADPVEYWALYSKSYYENLFMEIDDRYELLDTYKYWLKRVRSGVARAALTFFYRLRRDEIDDKLDWSLVEQRVSNFLRLFESPDNVSYGGGLSFVDNDALPFGYYKGKMYVGYFAKAHHSIRVIDSESGKETTKDRMDFKYAGRLWTDSKIISFWEYPPKDKMRKILIDIEEIVKEELNLSLNLLTDPDWKIEIVTATNKESAKDDPEYKFDWRGVDDKEIIPLKDYIGSKEWDPGTKAKAHVMSPLEKARKLTSKPSAYFKSQKRRPLPWRQAMYAESYNDIKFPRLKLFESPDSVDYDGELSWSSGGVPFGYYEGKMYVGEFESTHSEIDIIHLGKEITVPRKDFKYSGRLWPNSKVISFWEYPSKDEMRKVLSDIEEVFKERYNSSLNLLTDTSWEIEIIIGTSEEVGKGAPSSDFDWEGVYGDQSKVIPLKDYIGSKEWDQRTKAQAHVMSPLEKARKLTSKPSAYFKSQKRRPLPWRQAMYAESRNGNHNLVPTSLNEFLKFNKSKT